MRLIHLAPHHWLNADHVNRVEADDAGRVLLHERRVTASWRIAWKSEVGSAQGGSDNLVGAACLQGFGPDHAARTISNP